MRKLGVKLNAFDLLYWVNDNTVGSDSIEQSAVRNTIIKFMDLDDHWCKDESVCEVCQRPEGIYTRGRIGEIINHEDAVAASDRKYIALSTRLASFNLSMDALYTALISSSSHTLVRAISHQGIITDFGEMHYSRRGSFAVLGSDLPILVQAEGFGSTAFDGNISVTFFLDEPSEYKANWDSENTLAANGLVDFIRESLDFVRVGDVEMPTTIERIEEEVFALGGFVEGERETVRVERHKVINANKSHPVLGRLTTGEDVWQIVSDGAGRSINDAMRTILASKGDPSLTTAEAIILASIVFSKRGIQQSVSS